MDDPLLDRYQEELKFIYELAGEFARQYPRQAQRLRLSADAVADPHVERLIQAFALLNARTRLKLDDEFPEISDALLEVLYPHYLAPIPSMAIVQFSPSAQAQEAAIEVPRGTLIDTAPLRGERCRYRTGYAVQIKPLTVIEARYERNTLSLPPRTPGLDQARSVLILRLASSGEKPLDALFDEPLRFFLRGQAGQTASLYEMLFARAVQVVVSAPGAHRSARFVAPDAIRPVGFESDEGMFEYPARSLVAYRLLSEFFAFPQKFLFFDLHGLARTLAPGSREVQVAIAFSQVDDALEHTVDGGTFALGCTPVVNLFPRTADVINLDHTRSEYLVVPDARHRRALEVYTVDRVMAESVDDGTRVEFAPFYGLRHGETQRVYWNLSRRLEPGGDGGSEVYLGFHDLALDTRANGGWTVKPEVTCLNRNLPRDLPADPDMQLADGGTALRVRCLTPPTATLRPVRREAGHWRLVSHLSLNHLSLADAGGTEALREILRLYNPSHSSDLEEMIKGLVSVTARRAAARVSMDGRSTVAHGLEVDIELDARVFTSTGAYLFAAVLERFLGVYASINAFTRLVARVQGQDGVLRRWPARTGERTLL